MPVEQTAITQSNHGSNGSILIVDNDRNSRGMVESMLKEENYNLVFAANGSEALRNAEAFSPDAVLLDVTAPEMNGYEVCRRLRASPTAKNSAVLILANADDCHSSLKIIQEGVDDFITKPVEREILRIRLRNIIRRKFAEKALRIALDELVRRKEEGIAGLAHTTAKLQQLHKELEAQEQIEEKWRGLLEVAEFISDTIVITDSNGVIQYVNPAFQRMTGFSLHELTGQTPYLFRSGKHDESFGRALWDTIAQGKIWRGWFANKKKDQSIYEEEAVIAPIRNRTGAIIYYVKVGRGVPGGIEHEFLPLHPQEMETRSNQAGKIAHDLNNILTAILGYTCLAMNDVHENGPTYQKLIQIDEAGKRATSLIKELGALKPKTEEKQVFG